MCGSWPGGMMLPGLTTVLALIALVVTVLLAAVLVMSGRKLLRESAVGPRLTTSGTEAALDILKTRYARGEIDDEEFNKRLDHLLDR